MEKERSPYFVGGRRVGHPPQKTVSVPEETEDSPPLPEEDMNPPPAEEDLRRDFTTAEE